MNISPLSDIVSSQYERWMYPEPILDIGRWLISNWQWFDPSHAHPVLWPNGGYRAELDMLVAGCGTNQAAVLAYTNPKARIVAIDVSGPSIDHHRFLKTKYGLKNLELVKMPVEDVHLLEGEFDLIISTGVLHHMADPQAGMNALAGKLRINGVLAIMLYARYGRTGVEMLQSAFREAGLGQNDSSILLVKDALSSLPEDHPIKSYVKMAPDLKFDAGLVDTFLHGRERSYAVQDCLDLVNSAGLAFQGWFMNAPYHAPQASSSSFVSLVSTLSEEQQWKVMEKINFRNACHFFMACRPDRPVETYRIDFGSERALSFVPRFRYRCGMNGRKLYRSNWSVEANALEASLVGLADGVRTIRDIAHAATAQASLSVDAKEVEGRALSAFRTMWRLDLMSMGVPSGSLAAA